METTELKKQSDRSYSIALAKQNALEKAKSKQILAYNGHLFLADAHTINLVKVLKEQRQEFVILDSNDNPALIDKSEDFLEKLIAKNQEVLNTYHQEYQQFKKLR